MCRRVGRGLARLEQRRGLPEPLRSGKQETLRLSPGYLAQWVDVGFQRPALVKEIVDKFSGACAPACPCSTICICGWRRAWWR